tara:strand:+ start:3601 stop:5916 length:2316 start_codon:yes stop_codon:yes gene_type:complete
MFKKERRNKLDGGSLERELKIDPLFEDRVKKILAEEKAKTAGARISTPCFEIGDTGPGGGIVFATPFTSYNNTPYYFEAFPWDQEPSHVTLVDPATGAPIPNWMHNCDAASFPAGCEFGSYGLAVVPHLSAAMGDGDKNTDYIDMQTQVMLPQHPTHPYNDTHDIAATRCLQSGGPAGTDDWFLPSIIEAYMMMDEIGPNSSFGNVFGFQPSGAFPSVDSWYWTSTDLKATMTHFTGLYTPALLQSMGIVPGTEHNYAMAINTGTGAVGAVSWYIVSKCHTYAVRPIRKFEACPTCEMDEDAYNWRDGKMSTGSSQPYWQPIWVPGLAGSAGPGNVDAGNLLGGPIGWSTNNPSQGWIPISYDPTDPATQLSFLNYHGFSTSIWQNPTNVLNGNIAGNPGPTSSKPVAAEFPPGSGNWYIPEFGLDGVIGYDKFRISFTLEDTEGNSYNPYSFLSSAMRWTFKIWDKDKNYLGTWKYKKLIWANKKTQQWHVNGREMIDLIFQDVEHLDGPDPIVSYGSKTLQKVNEITPHRQNLAKWIVGAADKYKRNDYNDGMPYENTASFAFIKVCCDATNLVYNYSNIYTSPNNESDLINVMCDQSHGLWGNIHPNPAPLVAVGDPGFQWNWYTQRVIGTIGMSVNPSNYGIYQSWHNDAFNINGPVPLSPWSPSAGGVRGFWNKDYIHFMHPWFSNVDPVPPNCKFTNLNSWASCKGLSSVAPGSGSESMLNPPPDETQEIIEISEDDLEEIGNNDSSYIKRRPCCDDVEIQEEDE